MQQSRRCRPGRGCRRSRARGCTGVDSESLQRCGSSIGRWVCPGAALASGADGGYPANDSVHRWVGQEWDALTNGAGSNDEPMVPLIGWGGHSPARSVKSCLPESAAPHAPVHRRVGGSNVGNFLGWEMPMKYWS